MHLKGRAARMIAWGAGVCVVAVVAAACGTTAAVRAGGTSTPTIVSSTTTSVPVATTTSTTGATVVATQCKGSQLSLGTKTLQAGGGQDWMRWSVTNSSLTACDVYVGLPRLAVENATGAVVQSFPFKHGQLSKGSGVLQIQPGKSAYFLMDGFSGCWVTGHATGGPFKYVLTLPLSSVKVIWSAPGLRFSTMRAFCAQQPIAEGVLQGTAPGVPTE